MAKKKLSEVVSSQTHGKSVDAPKFKPTSLEQILGTTGQSRFGTMDEDEYTGRLKNMDKADLQAHAAKIGLMPVDDRARLEQGLLREFRLHIASFRVPNSPKNTHPKISAEAAKILALGR